MAKKQQQSLRGTRTGRGGTWIEVKTVHGHRYVYERNRVYGADGTVTLTSKYLYKLNEEICS